MKEQKRTIFFIILLVGITLLSFAEEKGKSMRITGIDPKFSSFFYFELMNTADGMDNDSSIAGYTPVGESNMSNRTLTATIHNYDLDNSNWTGTGDFYIHIVFIEDENWIFHSYVSKRKVSFVNNITEISFSDFNLIRSGSGQ